LLTPAAHLARKNFAILEGFVIILGLMDPKYAMGRDPNLAYDALADKHASFYFSGYGVKKHLKKLRKVGPS
jgi:hypothetical protein